MRTPRFEIFRSPKDEQFYFRLKAKNGRIILSSEGYTAKHNCKSVIEVIKGIFDPTNTTHPYHADPPNADSGISYIDFKDECGNRLGKIEILEQIDYDHSPHDWLHTWFNIQAINGEIIGRSETYTSKAGAKKGIASVRRCAPIAEIVDLTKD